MLAKHVTIEQSYLLEYWVLQEVGVQMESLERVANLLRYRGRKDLSSLLSHARVEFQSLDEGFSLHGDNMVIITKAMIVAPISTYDRLTGLSKEDHDVVLGALQEIWPFKEQEGDLAITEIGYRLDPASMMEDSQEIDSILQLLAHIRNVMVDVSTGGRSINGINPKFKEEFAKLTARLTAKGLRNPLPYPDL